MLKQQIQQHRVRIKEHWQHLGSDVMKASHQAGELTDGVRTRQQKRLQIEEKKPPNK